MDTNKENELMQNLEEEVGGGQAGHLPDGRPLSDNISPSASGRNTTGGYTTATPGAWQTVNPPQQLGRPMPASGANSQAREPRKVTGNMVIENPAIENVTPEIVSRIEAYGAEAVYDASKNK